MIEYIFYTFCVSQISKCVFLNILDDHQVTVMHTVFKGASCTIFYISYRVHVIHRQFLSSRATDLGLTLQDSAVE